MPARSPKRTIALSAALWVLPFAAVAAGGTAVLPALGDIHRGALRLSAADFPPGRPPQRVLAFPILDQAIGATVRVGEAPAVCNLAGGDDPGDGPRSGTLLWRCSAEPAGNAGARERSEDPRPLPAIIFPFDVGVVVSGSAYATSFEAEDGRRWRLVTTASREGFHRIIQEFRGDRCLRSIDYYAYAGYDTGGDAEAVRTAAALCGEVIERRDQLH